MRKRFSIRSLLSYAFDAALGVLSLLSALLMVIASSDPVPTSLQGTWIHPLLRQFATGNQIVFDLSVGILAGVFMYYLVVRVPERSKRRRLKTSLRAAYELCKQECIRVYLGCFMPSYDANIPYVLSSQEIFRKFFNEEFAPGQTRWHAVANGLTEERLRDLVVELEILLQEIHFTLGAVEVKDPHTFEFFKAMSRVLYRSKTWTTDYDSTKSLLRFLWTFHTGWSWIDGYKGTDPIADMIAAI